MRRLLALVLLLSACGGGSGNGDDDPLPPWDPGLPASIEMKARRGMTPARGIIHLHSPYSHDACDGEPRATDGTPDMDCSSDLRAGLCATRMDFAALTDHDASMADEPWGADLLIFRNGDELILDGEGRPIANRMACPDGHSVLVTVGGENDLMPIMLDDHPAAASVQELHDVYNASDAAAVSAYRTAGGLAWVAHSEQQDFLLLQALKLDGMEIYNLHAAVDPNIREDWLMLDGPQAIQDALLFLDPEPTGPEPDLAVLAFLEPQRPSLGKWGGLLAQGDRIVGTAGTDAHQNVLQAPMRDGERVDSYRRMMRWFSNVVLAADPTDPASIEAALAFGRVFVAFEILGTPVGFDFWADAMDGTRTELGGEVRVTDRPTLVAVTPYVFALDPTLPAPAIHTVIIRNSPEGEAEVAVGDGALQFDVDKAGAYRVEIRMTPHHLEPYLGTLGPEFAKKEQVWIYSNPIYVRP